MTNRPVRLATPPGVAGRRALLMIMAVGIIAMPVAVASAEPEGVHCTTFAYPGDECNATNAHHLTRSSTYTSAGYYVSAGAFTSGGGTYASLVYGTGYACHPYGAGTYLYGRSRNSSPYSGNLSGSQYWLGTSC